MSDCCLGRIVRMMFPPDSLQELIPVTITYPPKVGAVMELPLAKPPSDT